MRCPCSRSCHSCANAVAELSLQPSPPSRSPCRHVAVALSWSRCHCALAGDRHAYPPSAVPRCLVGPVALGFVPCWRSRQSCRCCRGGWSPRVRALRRTCQLPGRPRLCAPLGVVVGIIVGAVVGVLIARGGGRHRPWHHPSSMQTPPRQLPCVKPPSSRADIRALCGACHIHALLRQRPLPRCWWRRRSPRLGAARR